MVKSFVFRSMAGLILAAWLGGCASTKVKVADFEVIPVHFQTAYQELGPRMFVIKSEADLQKAMETLQLRLEQDLPELGFYLEKHTVVLLYGGMQRSNGFLFGAESVTVRKQAVNISARLLAPDADCQVAQVITFPLQLIAIEHQGGSNFVLDLVQSVRPCR